MKHWFCPYCDGVLEVISWWGSKDNPITCRCNCRSFKYKDTWIGRWSRNRHTGEWSYLHPEQGWGKYEKEPILIQVLFV